MNSEMDGLAPQPAAPKKSRKRGLSTDSEPQIVPIIPGPTKQKPSGSGIRKGSPKKKAKSSRSEHKHQPEASSHENVTQAPVPETPPVVPLPPLTSEFLEIDTVYYDLGYIVRDVNTAIPENLWRTKICRFSFLISPDASSAKDIEAMNDMPYLRLLCTASEAPSMLLLPDNNVVRCIKGRLQFNYSGNAVDVIEALRHYVPAYMAERLGCDIDLPPLPLRTLKGDFFLGGGRHPWKNRPRMLYGLTKSKELYFVGQFDESSHQMNIDVYLAEDFFKHDEEYSEAAESHHDIIQTKRVRLLMEMGKEIVVKDNPLLEMLFVEKGYVPSRENVQAKLLGDHISPHDLVSLFHHVQAVHADQTILSTPKPQHSRLKLQMHTYQQRAVSWMITKEQTIMKNLCFPHPLYFPIETSDGYQLYMHASTGRLSETHPAVPASLGGILADEMGLGKTLETISLILANPSPLSKPKNPQSAEVDEPALPGEWDCKCIDRGVPLESMTAQKIPRISCNLCGVTRHKTCFEDPYRPKNVKYLCGKCQRNHRILCKTTLVVAPAAIIPQWQNEIEKSARGLTVFQYQGVAVTPELSPWEMASYDIVLASYEILSSEILYFHAEVRKESLRKGIRRRIVRSPLLAIRFWRFVLDEAQMVESQTSNYAEMAMKIHAQFYWAVTGTPIQRGVADLQALFSFIEFAPWSIWKCFSEYVAGPFKADIREPLQDLLGECMWRLEKSSVENEMDLPPCTVQLHKLTFSGIEMQLYQQVYRDCIKMVTTKLRQGRYRNKDIYDKKVSELDWDLVKTLRTWMGHLEKLCTSPTRVKYFFRETKKKKDEEKNPEDENDSLKRMVKTLLEKAKLEFTTTLRTCILACDGAAGIYWLMEKYPEAAEMYREAKRLWTDNEQFVKVDIGQKMHILSNLGELLAQHRDAIPPTLEDDQLLDQADALKVDFLGKNKLRRENATKEVHDAWFVSSPAGDGQKIEVRHDTKTLQKAILPVYSALRCVANCQQDAVELVQECKLAALGGLSADAKHTRLGRSRAMDSAYQTLDGLKFVLQGRWSIILEEREKIMELVKEVMEYSMKEDESFIIECAACHLTNSISINKRCRLCVLEKAFTGYEDLIFRTVIELIDDDDDAELTDRQRKQKMDKKNLEGEGRVSNRADSDFEKVCKTISTYLRQKRYLNGDKKRKYIKDYTECEAEWKHFQLVLDLLKKEQICCSSLYQTLWTEVSTCDELRQSLMRLRFATEDEMAVCSSLTKPKQKEFMEFRSILNPSDKNLQRHLGSFQAMSKEYSRRLGGDISRFKYIQNMHDGYVNEGQVQQRECCVCYDAVGKDWALFPCAHIICRTCLKMMEKEAANQHMSRTQCPLCRKLATKHEIVQANGVQRQLSPVKTQYFDTLCLKGAPQKMEAVVREIFRLNGVDPDAKILIFSDYTESLEDYTKILVRNGLTAIYVKAKAGIPVAIEKLRSGRVKILLMPISMGGKGLTIIEATHLFFLEPIMNKAAELQAIGRIHRMGQTKPTFVHKFIVEQTIEEQIHQMISTMGEEGNLLQQDLTLRQTLDLLKSAGFHGPDAADGDIWNIEAGTVENEGVIYIEEDDDMDNQPSTSGM
ncbi:E3 ubiquitin-protein ligase SHPRH-like [Paramacrobiotus metropolitanus]|uniref:E3 ubiquitin-protein ligase SHPRH-like n=1 Tax=Paramacrobiotus metropolitanus TaxID=2943436 RepID=UPI0024465193|nr:E3 ubiquitin-protein ligase SHPRH-like [Paramacrobiotus metropolitanus]